MKNVTTMLLMAGVALVLSGCGGSNGNSVGDNFINSVRAVINNTSETADAERIDNFAGATSPEESDPQPL